MTDKNKKQFGIWMDLHHATVAGRENVDTGNFVILGHIVNPVTEPNSTEKAAHNAERGMQQKYFKEITALMQNAEEVHLTGTGTAQEQLMHYMEETPQFKNTVTQESTSNKMSDENLVEFIAAKFN